MCKKTMVAAALIWGMMISGGTGKASAQESGVAKGTPEATEPGHDHRHARRAGQQCKETR